MSGTLDAVCAYIDGLNAATGCLASFREWLVTRFEDGDNLTWVGLFRLLCKTKSVEQGGSIERLGLLMDEFYAFHKGCASRGVAQMRIYLRYHAWLLNQPHYHPGFPQYIPPYDGISLPLHSE